MDTSHGIPALEDEDPVSTIAEYTQALRDYLKSTGWITLSLANGWDHGGNLVQIRSMAGLVTMRGFAEKVSGSLGSSFETVLTLPNQFLPPSTHRVSGTGAKQQPVQIRLQSGGAVRVSLPSNGPSGVDWVSFDNAWWLSNEGI